LSSGCLKIFQKLKSPPIKGGFLVSVAGDEWHIPRPYGGKNGMAKEYEMKTLLI